MKYLEFPLENIVVKIKVRYSDDKTESKKATTDFLNTIALYLHYGYDELKRMNCSGMAEECNNIRSNIFEYLKKLGCYK